MEDETHTAPSEAMPAMPPAALAPASRPSEATRAEVEQILERDQSRVGEVYRGLRRGLSADEIATELSVSTSNFVWNYQRSIDALLDGDLPSAPSVAIQTARRFRTILRLPTLTPDTRAYVERSAEELERRANDETAKVIEDRQAVEQTERAEARNEAGVYVYALPHYLRFPYDPDSGRTLMKVGRSDSDVIIRFRSQTRTTALPEEPVLLRIYRADGATASIESTFHRLLEAADHTRSVARTAGREWFLTTTRFLDEIARALHLPVEVINDALTAGDD